MELDFKRLCQQGFYGQAALNPAVQPRVLEFTKMPTVVKSWGHILVLLGCGHEIR